MEKEKIESEFSRIASQLVVNGDLDVLCDLITLETKESFIKEYNADSD